MRLCCALPCFFKCGTTEEFIAGVQKAAALGYDCVETYNWKGLDLSAIKSACADAGVEFLSMCTTEFRMTDPAFRGAWLDGLKESCEAAVKAGASRLITQVGPDTGAPRAEQHAAIAETLELAKPILDETGIIIMLEPLNTYVNHPGYYLWSAYEGFDIIREANHPLIKLVYDIYHQQIMEGNIIPSITKNLDCIAHLHSAGHPGRIELFKGENDYNFIFDAVDAAGYKGACGLEYHPTLDPEESLRQIRARYAK